MKNKFTTYHAGCLHGLGHTARIGLAPERVTVEVLAPGVHDEGKRVNVPAHTHEGQETDAALHQHLLLLLLLRQP